MTHPTLARQKHIASARLELLVLVELGLVPQAAVLGVHQLLEELRSP
jgi:hypothetical protein